jgi:hypothetical protein
MEILLDDLGRARFMSQVSWGFGLVVRRWVWSGLVWLVWLVVSSFFLPFFVLRSSLLSLPRIILFLSPFVHNSPRSLRISVHALPGE